jgi:glycosyltransferase involved in cell wall biosynthesis
MLNGEACLERCLASLAEQADPGAGVEVLLVDNGSTDGSPDIARRFDGKVRLLREPVRGAYRARNHGVAGARGDIVAFTDSDCVPERSWIRNIVATFGDPRLAVLCGKRLPGGASSLLSDVLDYENAKADFVFGSEDAALYHGYCCNMAVRRSVLAELGPFAERPRGSDTLFVQRVVAERSLGSVRYAADVVVTHLEMDGLATYFRKVFLYGHHRRRHRDRRTARALTFGERMQVFRNTVTTGQYSTGRAAALLGVLGVGSLAWSLGAGSGRLRAARR